MTVAEAKIMTDKKHVIIGHDIDPVMIDIARKNARNAGVEEYIDFSVRDFMTTSVMPDFNVISTEMSTANGMEKSFDSTEKDLSTSLEMTK